MLNFEVTKPKRRNTSGQQHTVYILITNLMH